MKRVAVFGGGRMGRQLAQTLGPEEQAQLAAVVSPICPDWLAKTPWFSRLEELPELPDLLIDFTLPDGTAHAARWCRANLVPLLSGTTGLGEAQQDALRGAAELIPVLWSPNLSKGVNLLMHSAAATAAALAPETPVEILDIHHVHKLDAPSGTSLMLAQAIAAARGQELDQCLRTGAGGETPGPGEILCLSRREGEVIGQHRVTFHCEHEQVQLMHRAQDRRIYAAGAVEAGLWLIRQQAGLYSAASWLGS